MYHVRQFQYPGYVETDLYETYRLHTDLVHHYGYLHRYPTIEGYKVDFIPTLDGKSKSLYTLYRDSSPFGLLTLTHAFDWSGAPQLQMNMAFIEHPCTEDSLLMDFLANWIRTHGQSHENVALIHYNDELTGLAERFMARKCLHANNYSLEMDALDTSFLSDACRTFADYNKDLTLSYQIGINEEHIESYCNLFMETQEDMPDTKEPAFIRYPLTVDKQHQNIESNVKNGITHHCFMLHDNIGNLVAMTNVRTSESDPRFPYQFMISVKRPYRGRNLGKWLYAEMYSHLMKNHPFETVLVCHHPDNTPAITVSEWIGYRHAYKESLEVLTL